MISLDEGMLGNGADGTGRDHVASSTEASAISLRGCHSCCDGLAEFFSLSRTPMRTSFVVLFNRGSAVHIKVAESRK